MIIVNHTLYHDEAIITIFSTSDEQSEREICILTDFLQACKGVEVDDYFLESNYSLYYFKVYLKPDYYSNWIKLRESLDNNMRLYCSISAYNINN